MARLWQSPTGLRASNTRAVHAIGHRILGGVRRAVHIPAAIALVTMGFAFVEMATANVAEADSATITNVIFSGTEAAPTVTVLGSGFGTESDLGAANVASNDQNCNPATGYDYGTNFYSSDDTNPGSWVAGLGPPALAAVGVIISSYTDNQVIFTPGSCYGQNNWIYYPGNSFTMNLLGASFSGSISFQAQAGWTQPADVDSSDTFSSVSCVSPNFCAAVDEDGDALTFNGSAWSAATEVSELPFYSVSCPTDTFCVAVGAEGQDATWNGSNWNQQNAIDSFNLYSVSCTAADFCIAVDSDGQYDIWNGASWSGPTSIDPGVPLQSVSCTSPNFCMAVDAQGNALMTSDGTSWSSPDDIDADESFDSVSCTSFAFCIALDNIGDALTYNGSAWSSTDIAGETQLNSVSCSSTSFCYAVDYRGVAFGYNGSGWSSTDIDGGSSIASVSCPTSSFCAAVDVAGNALTYGPVTSAYTCTVSGYGDATDPISLSESPPPPPSITAPGTYQTTVSSEVTIPSTVINAAIADGATRITIGSQLVTVDGQTGGNPSSSVNPNTLTASATNLPISFAPQANTPFTYTTNYSPEAWQTASNPGTVDFTPGDVDSSLTYLVSGSPMSVSSDCTPPAGVAALGFTVVSASSSSPTFQVPPSLPPLDSVASVPNDAGWAIQITNTSTQSVNGLSAEVTGEVSGEEGSSPLNYDFTGMDDTGTNCVSSGSGEATCSVGTLATGDSVTLNVLAETTGLAEGTSIAGTVDVSASNASSQTSDLGEVDVEVVKSGAAAVAVPTIPVTSTTSRLSDKVPAKVTLSLPKKVPAMGPFGPEVATGVTSFGGGKVSGPPVSVTMQALAGSKDTELCPPSAGGCEGDIVEVEGNFSAYTSLSKPISVVVEIFYGSTVPAGSIYYQVSANDSPQKLAACVKTGADYNTPCVSGAEQIIGKTGKRSTEDTIFFTGGDPLVGRR